jgi:tRNA1Val (adenine37-N6)-methyltransferase
MPNNFFRFKQFMVNQDKCAMKVNTDSCIFGAIIEHPSPQSILDIGTGTGVLALMMAQRFPFAQIQAVEIDSSAAKQAAENFNLSPWKERLKVFHLSVQEFSSSSDLRFDLIISNPPWFTRHHKSPDVKRSLARHNDFLPFNDLAMCVSGLISPTGIFYITLPLGESEQFNDIMIVNGLLKCSEILIRPGPSHEPNRMISGYSAVLSPLKKSGLIIFDSGGNYSTESVRLLRDFYLAF